ncbi:MAG: mechanosensitive ion channel [Candidatus Riflebacteria bacterium]|nr:mechanosensitive ion channel [Candidatus Riflebacteria bacterium]
MDQFMTILPPVLTITAVIATLGASYWLLLGKNPNLGNERRFPRQILLLGLTIAGLLTIVFALPISENSRNQLIGLIGLVISGIIALSSTSIVSNLMAGILLRITMPFRTGDFIKAADFFGRVSERGLFDTEIQTETRDLIALPNTFLITNPVTTIRSSGTIISATVSLGYDVHHSEIETALIRAAENSGLEEPFVHILELGNFSVNYRISGLLKEVKTLITAKSDLFQHVLDALHEQNIEIMSPGIMNQRRIPEDKKVIPARSINNKPETRTNAETIAFDKAEAAEAVEKTRQNLLQDIERLEAEMSEAPEEAKQQITKKIEECRINLQSLDKETENAEQYPPEETTAESRQKHESTTEK